MTLLRQLACVSKKLNEYVMGDEVWGAVLRKFTTGANGLALLRKPGTRSRLAGNG